MGKYYHMEWNKIYNEDCVQGLKKLEDNCADIIIAEFFQINCFYKIIKIFKFIHFVFP